MFSRLSQRNFRRDSLFLTLYSRRALSSGQCRRDFNIPFGRSKIYSHDDRISLSSLCPHQKFSWTNPYMVAARAISVGIMPIIVQKTMRKVIKMLIPLVFLFSAIFFSSIKTGALIAPRLVQTVSSCRFNLVFSFNSILQRYSATATP